MRTRELDLGIQREDSKSSMVPIMKLVTFRERVPGSTLSSTSKIGIHVEPLTHAFKTWEKHTLESQTSNKYDITNTSMVYLLVFCRRTHIKQCLIRELNGITSFPWRQSFHFALPNL